MRSHQVSLEIVGDAASFIRPDGGASLDSFLGDNGGIEKRSDGRGRDNAAVWMRVALRRIVNKVLVPHLRVGTVVLEVGAGTDEFSVLMENELPPGTNWMRTDQSLKHPGQTVATLPHLPEISDGSADLVAELSVADAIPLPVLVGSFEGMWRVLKSGGRIIRIMDLKEDPGILGPEVSDRGCIPLLYTKDSEGREFSRQIALLDRERLRAQMPALRQGVLSSADADKIEYWLDLREGVLSDDDPAWRRESLLGHLRKLKVLRAEMDLATYAQNRLMEALFEAARIWKSDFEIEFCGPVTEEKIVRRSTLKGLPQKAAVVASRYGLIMLWENDPFGPHSDKFVRVRATAIVLMAQKKPLPALRR